MTSNFNKLFYMLARIAGVGLAGAIPFGNVATNCCVLILLLTWLGSGIKQHLAVIFTSRTTWAITGVLLLYAVGAFYTAGDIYDALLMLKKMSRLFLIPVIMSLFTDPNWRRYAYYAFWWAILLSLLFVIIKLSLGYNEVYQLLTNLHLLTMSKSILVENIAFVDRIFTSLLFSFASFSLLHYGTAQTFALGSLQQNGKPKIIALILAICCAFYLLQYCDGRSGQIIWLGLMILFFLQKKMSWQKNCWYGLVLVLVCGLAWYSNKINKLRYQVTVAEAKAYCERTVDPRALPQQCTGLRLEFAQKSLLLAAKAPYFGHGTGAFRTVYNKYYSLRDFSNNKIKVENPHNQYLLTAVELGIVGLLVLLVLFIVMLLESRLLPRLERFLMQGVIFTIMVGSMANSWLMDFISMHYFVFFVGLSLAALPANTMILSSTGKRISR